MQQYARQPSTLPHTPDRQSGKPRQAPLKEILQTYTNDLSEKLSAHRSFFPIQCARKTKTELFALALNDFYQHTHSEQFDWANDPAITTAERKLVWKLLEEAHGKGLDHIEVEQFIRDLDTDEKKIICLHIAVRAPGKSARPKR